MNDQTYNLGERCPTCGEHLDSLSRAMPPHHNFEPVILSADDLPPVEVECKNGHTFKPHPRWLQSPRPTVTYAP